MNETYEEQTDNLLSCSLLEMESKKSGAETDAECSGDEGSEDEGSGGGGEGSGGSGCESDM